MCLPCLQRPPGHSSTVNISRTWFNVESYSLNEAEEIGYEEAQGSPTTTNLTSSCAAAA